MAGETEGTNLGNKVPNLKQGCDSLQGVSREPFSHYGLRSSPEPGAEDIHGQE